ncbi:hypothetical protein MIND_00454300 [Mycena indigotica]|uniref:Uncharacterized protein n=1 Tax=Mycena indigotica TaxID=2126181 RepID=A0A8H6W5K4_9AGAR|nr:uncharacterized protein MIND_00454300 [Mycena indigotica]KAF7306629.1 hypothetical protein MIND_00454300 [Mycena indigotica]
MSRLPPPHYNEASSSRYPTAPTWPAEPPLGHFSLKKPLLTSSKPPAPTLRDVLGAYKANGDGDREVLLAVLKAKTSEDNRQAALATLYDSMLQLHRVPVHNPYPTPAYTHSPPEPSHPYRHYRNVSSLSRSPPPVHTRPPISQARSISPRAEHRRKRARNSHSPGSEAPAELPPSPYSSSADSPRSRGSMAIGSLLTVEPTTDSSGEERPQPER